MATRSERSVMRWLTSAGGTPEPVAAAAAGAPPHLAHIAFLLTCGYLAIAFAGTSDELLLRGDPIKLPLFGIGMPLLGFFWSAPLPLLLLHLKVLLNLRLVTAAGSAPVVPGAGPPAARLSGLERRLFEGLAWTGLAVLPLFGRHLEPSEKRFLREAPPAEMIEQLGYEEAVARYGRGLDLRGRDLRYARLDRADLPKANLAEAMLQGADLREAELRGANLRAAKMQGARLFRAGMQEVEGWLATLQGADLRRAVLGGAYLRRADFRGAWLWGASLEGASAVGSRLEGADLRNAVLTGADLAQAQLQGADLRQAVLAGAILARARLEGADLRGADLRAADLRAAGLWRAKVDAADAARWGLADLRGAGADPISDVAALLREHARTIASSAAATHVQEWLRLALIEDDRPAEPAMLSRPAAVPVADELARFLGDLACGETGGRYLAAGIARRIAFRNADVEYAPLVADRLLADCPPAAALAASTRRTLQALLP